MKHWIPGSRFPCRKDPTKSSAAVGIAETPSQALLALQPGLHILAWVTLLHAEAGGGSMPPFPLEDWDSTISLSPIQGQFCSGPIGGLQSLPRDRYSWY